MQDVFMQVFNNMSVFMLILARMSGIFIASPIFGRRNIPAYFKIGFAFFMSLLVLMAYKFSYQIPTNVLEFIGVVIKEFIVGLIIGFISYMIFSAILLGGQIIDTAVGFGMANVVDPMSEIQVPLLGNFLYMYMLVIFFITDAHHVLIRGIFYSYKLVPIGYPIFIEGVSKKFVDFFIQLFVIGIEISLPVMMSMLVVDIILAVLSRAVPQMNVFMVGMPLKIAIGLLVLVIVLPIINKMIFVLIDKLSIYTFEALKGMVK